MGRRSREVMRERKEIRRRRMGEEEEEDVEDSWMITLETCGERTRGGSRGRM